MKNIDANDFYNEYYTIVKDNFVDFQDDGYDISIISSKRLVPTKSSGPSIENRYKIIRFSNITYKEINYLEVNIGIFKNKSIASAFSKSEIYLNIIANAKEHLKEHGLFLDIDSTTIHETSISNFIYRKEDMESNLNERVIINFEKYIDKINEESGIRNIKKLIKDHLKTGSNTFEIWMHIDLDGLTSCLAMKGYLERYGMKMIDAHKIQYGNMEFAIKNKKPDSMACIVDFAHFKSVFTIGTDHHEGQTGKVSGSSYARTSRSNVETISGKISFSDIFTPGDVELVRTVDSANFLTYNIKPEDVQNSIFKLNKELSGEKNRFMMGFVVNRLLLAYKNKRITVTSIDGKNKHVNKNILECMAIDCSPSLYSMFNTLKHYIKNAKTTNDKQGFLSSPESLKENLYDYIERMKDYKFIEDDKTGDAIEYDPNNWKHKNANTQRTTGSYFDKDYKIIIQYGGGSMYKAGSYDRYVPFKNNPNADFICMLWPMGLIQVSCNPFKEKTLDINLGEIAKEVLASHKEKLSNVLIPIDCIKKEYETSQDWQKMQREEGKDYKGIGFRYSDLIDFYGNSVQYNGSIIDISENVKVKELMDKDYPNLTENEKNILSSYKISEWDIITKGSGGHKSITNIQGFLFIKYNLRDFSMQYKDSKMGRYTDLMKKIGREIVNNLKQKIDIFRKNGEVTYKSTDVELSGQNVSEHFNYFLLKNGIEDKVSKDEFIKAGASRGMRPKANSVTIDMNDKKIVASFENFQNRFNA